MFVKLELIAQILDPKRPGIYTHYFFSRKHHILLPIESYRDPGLINPMTITLSQVLKSFYIEIKRVIIYLYKGRKYYTYLSLEQSSQNFEFNCDLFEVIPLHRFQKYPIFIKKEILTKKGIKITKRMLLKALEEDIYRI